MNSNPLDNFDGEAEIKWSRNRFSSPDRRAMAAYAIKNAGRTFKLEDLAAQATTDPKNLKYFTVAYFEGHGSSDDERSKAFAAMNAFIKQFNDQCVLYKKPFRLKVRGQVRPGTLAGLDSAEEPEEFLGISIEGERQLAVGRFRFAADPSRPTPLYVSVVRVNQVWTPPPAMAKAYYRRANREPDIAHNFSHRDHRTFPTNGKPLLSLEVNEERPWDGQCFACCNVVEKEIPEIAGRTIEISVSRIHFKDYWMATKCKDEFPLGPNQQKTQGASGSKNAQGAWPGQPAPYCMVFVATLVTLRRKGDGHQPCVALCLHRDVNQLYEPPRTKKGVRYWGPTAQSLCVSARIRDDPRPIDLVVQVQRMLQRQSGVEPNIGISPTWIGVAYEPEYHRLVLYALVEIDATPFELIQAFERRESRYLEEKMAILTEEDVVEVMKSKSPDEELQQLLGGGFALASTLPTALGLYLVYRNIAKPLPAPDPAIPSV